MKTLLPRFVQRRLDPTERYGLRLTLFAFAVSVVAIPFGWMLSQVLSEGWLVRVDTAAANNLHEEVRETRWVVWPLQVISFLGKPIFFYVLVGSVSVFLLRRARRRLATFLIASSIGAGLVDNAVKYAVSRPRPSLEEPVATAHGHSFPSGHAMVSTVVYGALLLVFLPNVPARRRKLAIAAVLVLVGAIGVSRLFLGVHYISDVVGGHLLGAAWLAASVAAFSIWREERGDTPRASSGGSFTPDDPPVRRARK